MRNASSRARGRALAVFSLLALGCSPQVDIGYCKATRGGTLGATITLEGRVHNTGNRTACDVKVEVEWKNPASPLGIVARESIPVVGSEGLAPGENRDFMSEEIHAKDDRWQFICRPVWSECG